MTMLGFVLYGSLVLLPMLLQTLLGYPALQAGIAMAPRGIGSFIGMPLVGILIGVRSSQDGGVRAVRRRSHAALARQINLNAGYWDFFWPQFVQGFALSMLFVPLTTIRMDPIPRERMGNATSLFNLMRNIGGSIGIATTGTMLARQQQAQINVLGAHVSALDPTTQTMFASMRAGSSRAAPTHTPRRSARMHRSSAWCSSRRRSSRSSRSSDCWGSSSCS